MDEIVVFSHNIVEWVFNSLQDLPAALGIRKVQSELVYSTTEPLAIHACILSLQALAIHCMHIEFAGSGYTRVHIEFAGSGYTRVHIEVAGSGYTRVHIEFAGSGYTLHAY